MLSQGLTDALVASWDFFTHLAVVLVPLFVGGGFLVGLVQEYLPPERVERVLRRYEGGVGNTVAAGIGALTPFCSCSTVPMLAGLLQARAPLGLAFSFLLASPLVNELAIVLLIGLFGFEVAILYVTVTLLSAIVLGMVISRLGLESHLKEIETLAPRDPSAMTDGGCSPEALRAANGDSCGSGTECSREPLASNPTHVERVRRAAVGAGAFFRELVPYLVGGMIIGALIHGFVPASVIGQYLGPGNPLAVPVAAVVGAPIYVSMSAMLPIAASLFDQGVPIGTVLAFVVGSAGVSVPNLVLLNKLFDRTLLAVYAGTVVAIGVLIGLLFNAILVQP